MSESSLEDTRPPLPLPPPDPWTAILSEQRQLDEQITQALTTAAILRSHADAIAGVVQRIVAHDRPDVWSGGRADEFRREVAAISARLLSPWAGVADQLRSAATRIEARARAWQAQLTPTSPCGTSSITGPLEAVESGCPPFSRRPTTPG